MSLAGGYKLDLHTHSYGSPDGALGLRDYRYFLHNKLLDYIAITDHNRIDIAQKIQKELAELGDRIIIGEEITTTQGEVIGLYLTEAVPAGLTLAEAVGRIKAQGGLVYVPHPFETVRSGIAAADLAAVKNDVAIIETSNGRAVFQNRGPAAVRWAEQHAKSSAASSDAHGRFGWGRTYSLISQAPTRANLAKLLGDAPQSRQKVGIGIVYPKLNRLKGKITGAGKR